jgi:hypothetical protein
MIKPKLKKRVHISYIQAYVCTEQYLTYEVHEPILQLLNLQLQRQRCRTFSKVSTYIRENIFFETH